MRDFCNIEIRPARLQDAAAIAALLHQLGYERPPAEVAPHIQASAANPETRILVALTPDGRIAGCLQAVITRRLAEGDCGEIASLVVDAACRSQGIGAHLVQKAAEWLQTCSIGRLRVRCNLKRARAHRFYENFGFQHTKSQKVFDIKL
jgi:N-acetylglutamate synthase-like GNAT family acetyltransferase